MMDKVKFGKALQEARQAVGLDLLDVADTVDCKMTILRDVEQGMGEITVGLLVDLAQLYNKPVAYFFADEIRRDTPTIANQGEVFNEGIRIAAAQLARELPPSGVAPTWAAANAGIKGPAAELRETYYAGYRVPGWEEIPGTLRQIAPGSKYADALGARVPVVGERVLYCMDRDSTVPGQLRPADVVYVWGDQTPNAVREVCDLVVIVDGRKDYEHRGYDRGKEEILHVRKTSCKRFRGVVPGSTPGQAMPWGEWVFPEQVDYTSPPQV